MKERDIKVKVEFTEGYEERFTVACLKQLEKREKSQHPPVFEVKNLQEDNQTMTAG